MAKKTPQIQPQSEFDALSEVQHRAAHLISSGVSYRSVADRLGINPCTLSEWQKRPAFRAEINKLLKDAREATQRRLVIASQVALETLIGICTKEDASDRDKITAASQILNLVKPSAVEPQSADPEILKERDAVDLMIEKWL